MNTITIVVKSEEFESINIDLTTEEVSALYQLKKDNALKIVDLEKELKTANEHTKYQNDERIKLANERDQANALLTALGVAEKAKHAEPYYQKEFPIATRIALYIAKGVMK
jgi:hypothetical protein